MLAIFYNRTSLRDTLIINVNNKQTTKINEQDNFVYGIDPSDKLTFINIFNLSKIIHLPDGYLMLDDSIADLVRQVTQYDLSLYNNDPLFVVGKIESCVAISGTHLHKCMINVGDRILSIVCGAKNVRIGLLVVVAMVGATLPNGLFISSGTLMGEKSNGMICSAAELHLHDVHYNGGDGIIELPDNFVVGSSFLRVFANSKLK
jgi:tRNA-binding protein